MSEISEPWHGVGFIDVTGESVRVSQPVHRLLSLVPSVTETLFALDRQSLLVGRTRYCVQPDPDVRKIEKIGGTKDPDLAKIRALRPGLVLANKEENRKEDIEALRESGITVHVAEPVTVKDGLAYVGVLGRMLECEELAGAVLRDGARALSLLQTRHDDLAAHNDLRVQPRKRVRPRVLTFIWNNPWMVVGGNTYIGDMVETLGGEHVLKGESRRYFELDPVEAAALAPDIMLFPDEPFPFKQADLDFWRDNFRDIPAVVEDRLRICDGRDLCWYGARIPDALRRQGQLLNYDSD